MPELIKLDASIRIADDRIALTYSALNLTDEEVLILNALYTHKSQQLVVDSNLVYTVVQDGSLTLAKAALPIPPGYQIEVPDVPYATRLGRRESMTEQLAIALPVVYYNPHDQVLKEETVRCTGVRFRLGYLRLADSDAVPVRVNSREYSRVKYRAALRSQRTVESETVSSVVAVHKRP